MTTTDDSTTGQPVGQDVEPELTPAQQLAYAALGARAENRADRAHTLLAELATEHGRGGVLDALRALCAIPVAALRHVCREGAGGTVQITVAEDKLGKAPEVWTVAAQCASELLAGTFGAHGSRIANAFGMINPRNEVAVLELVVDYVHNVLEAVAAAGGIAWGEYDKAVRDRSAQPGWSPT